MKWITILPYLCIFLFCAPPLRATPSPGWEKSVQELSFRLIDVENGLPENQVRSFFPLEDGRMLIFMEGTLALYNGGNFKILHSLPENYMGIVPPYADYSREIQRKVWIRSGNKLSILDLEKEALIRDPTEYLAQETGLKDKILDVFFDNRQCLWIFTDSGKLYRYSPEKKVLTPMPFPFSSSVFEAIYIQNHLFLLLRDGSVVCVQEDKLQPEYTKLLTRVKSKNPYFNCSRPCIVENGFYWGYRDEEGTGYLVYFDALSGEQKEIYACPDRFQSIARLENGSIAAAAFSKLYIFDAEGKLVLETNKIQTEDGSELSGLFLSLATDHQGGLWLSLSNRGALYHTSQRIRFTALSSRDFPGTTKDYSAVTLYPYGNDSLLVGTPGGMLMYDIKEKKYESFCKELNKKNCISLFKASENTLWLCASFDGMYRIDKKDEKATLLHPMAAGMEIPENMRSAWYSPSFGYWLLSKELGVSRFNPETYELQPLLKDFPDLIRMGLATHATLWNPHSILFATQNGIFVYDVKNNTVFYPEGNGPDALFKCRNTKFNSVLRDRRGWIWLGTHDGLNLYIPSRNEFYSFYQEQGLPNNTIQTVAEAEDEDLIYVATSNGLSLLAIDTLADAPVISIQNLGVAHGLLRGEYVERSFCMMPDGTLYFGGINGISVLTPEMLREKGRSYTPLFASLKIANREIGIDEKKEILNRSIIYTQRITLAYDQRSFALEFAAPHYANPGLTRYRYRLLGSKEEDWVSIPSSGTLGSVSFHSLSAGKYKFEVEAASFNQSWSSPATMEIVIRSPFYWNPVSWIVYLLIVFGVVYYIVLMRRRGRALLCALALQEERNNVALESSNNEVHEPKPAFDPKDLNLASLDEKFMQKVLDLLEQNMDNPDYGVEELSSQIGMVRVTLYRKLKSITGQTPVSFIRTLRLKRAAQYLKTGESVTRVADRVGFSDPQYFRKCFKEMYGMNPKTYQDQELAKSKL